MAHTQSIGSFGRPPRMRLVNVRTGVSRKVQFNPTEFEEIIGAEYARQRVPGLSHKVKQFIGTEDRTLPGIELFYENANYPSFSLNPILPTRRFLRSLVHPRRGGGRVTGGAPRVLFVWPGFLSFTTVITKLSLRYNAFNRMGLPCTMIATVDLEEIRDSIRLMEEVIDLELE
jgi:hypothetical protein